MFVDDADCLALGLGRLESSFILQLLLLLTHLNHDLVDIMGEICLLILKSKVIQRAERLPVHLQDSFSDQVLTLCLLVVADLLFNPK